VRNAEVVAEELRGRMLSLYERHLSADGKAVSYKALKRDPAFWEYVDATAELQRVREGRGVERGITLSSSHMCEQAQFAKATSSPRCLKRKHHQAKFGRALQLSLLH
jgi:hypothetical protein